MNKKSAALLPPALAGGVMLREAYLKHRAAANYPCSGNIVSVGKSRMNIWTQGRGTQNIVFLTGYGTPCPAVDFQPLLRSLENEFYCVVPEPLGYGASAQPHTRRSSVNIIEELREGLKKAGIKPPYILAGHSMSGLFMPVWCNLYPEEIKAVIAIDTSVPEQVNVPAVRNNRKVSTLIPALKSITGYARFRARGGDYDERLREFCMAMPQELPKIREIAANVSFGRGICGEGRCFTKNALYAQKFQYPPTLPIIMFVSLQMNKKVNSLGYDWLNGHKRQLKNVDCCQLITYDAPHYLHHEKAPEMAKETIEFMSRNNVC